MNDIFLILDLQYVLSYAMAVLKSFKVTKAFLDYFFLSSKKHNILAIVLHLEQVGLEDSALKVSHNMEVESSLV